MGIINCKTLASRKWRGWCIWAASNERSRDNYMWVRIICHITSTRLIALLMLASEHSVVIYVSNRQKHHSTYIRRWSRKARPSGAHISFILYKPFTAISFCSSFSSSPSTLRVSSYHVIPESRIHQSNRNLAALCALIHYLASRTDTRIHPNEVMTNKLRFRFTIFAEERLAECMSRRTWIERGSLRTCIRLSYGYIILCYSWCLSQSSYPVHSVPRYDISST